MLQTDTRKHIESGEHREAAAAATTQTVMPAGLAVRLSAAGADHWSTVLLAAGVPAGPVNTLDEGFDFAQKLGPPGIVDIPAAAADEEGDRPSRQVAHPSR